MDEDVRHDPRGQTTAEAIRRCAAAGGGRIYVHDADCRAAYAGRCTCEPRRIEVTAEGVTDR